MLLLPVQIETGDGRLDKIRAYVEEHFADKITLEDVARHCGVSVSTVVQLFQKQLGMGFHQYLTKHRMMAAEALICAGVSLEQVYKMVGYRDYSSFYRAFRKFYQCSPRTYRGEKQMMALAEK